MKDANAGPVESSTPTGLKVLTGVRGLICAAHEGPDGRLHGHTWSVTAWWNDSRCATEAKQTLDSYLGRFDHTLLPGHLNRGENIGVRVLEALGCAAVDVERPMEGIFARVERCTEQQLDQAREAVATDPRNAPFEDWRRSVLGGEHDDHPEILAAIERLKGTSA